jgi:hypothetical protein
MCLLDGSVADRPPYHYHRACALQVLVLREPWDWLLPALCAAGQPVLDPRFNFLIDPSASHSIGPAAPAQSAVAEAAPGEEPGPAAAAAVSLPPVPALPVRLLLGHQPLIGRPPFLGPLVQKLAATQHVLGGLDWSCSSSRPVQQLSTGLPVLTGPWREQRWTQLFTLLADHPPRDVQPDGVEFLRSLPMYRLVSPGPQQQQQQQQQQGHGQPVLGSSAADRGAGADSSGDGGQQTQLVALGSSTDWVLAPSAVLQACAGGLPACVLVGLSRACCSASRCACTPGPVQDSALTACDTRSQAAIWLTPYCVSPCL